MELYIHIPFCVRKCAYCDFLSFPQTKEIMQQYVEKLIEEIRWAGKQYPDRAISSIFIGGGTPSILKAEQMTAARPVQCLHPPGATGQYDEACTGHQDHCHHLRPAG